MTTGPEPLPRGEAEALYARHLEELGFGEYVRSGRSFER
jgi:hypothetical protein